MIKIKLAVITGSRADYGLLSYFLKEAKKHYDLNLIVTGSHLNNNFGNTTKYIKDDKIEISKKIDLEIKDGKGAVANSISIGVRKFNDFFEKKKYDFVILLGDRYEIFSCAIAAAIIRLPIIHLHGGEVTTNSYDEYFRHSISIFSRFHFVSTQQSFNRLVQLGKNPKNIFLVGGLGAANIKKIKLLDKQKLQNHLGIDLKIKNIFFIYHPETLEKNYGIEGLINSLKVLSELKKFNIFISSTNADTQYEKFNRIINKYTKINNHFKILTNLGHKIFLSCLNQMDAIVGNSSCGILEAPSLRVPTLNIGKRQEGRLKSKSVMDCGYKKEEIKRKLNRILTKKYTKKSYDNPYDQGDSVKKIIKKIRVLKKINLSKNKTFFDLNLKNFN